MGFFNRSRRFVKRAIVKRKIRKRDSRNLFKGEERAIELRKLLDQITRIGWISTSRDLLKLTQLVNAVNRLNKSMRAQIKWVRRNGTPDERTEFISSRVSTIKASNSVRAKALRKIQQLQAEQN